MDFLQGLVEGAKKLHGTVILPEGDEERTLEAAVRLAHDGVCKVQVVAGRRALIEETARRKRLNISGLDVVVPSLDGLDPAVLAKFVSSRVAKDMPEETARKLALEPLHFAALRVAGGMADACVAGARADTADVLRAAIHGVGTAPGIKLLSSFFIMVPPRGHPVVKKPVFYADCAVNPAPGSLGLRDIAVETARNFKRLFPNEPVRMSFLSFSTKGSAEHLSLKKIREAVGLVRSHFADDPSVIVDGELQFDAAVVPEVAHRKAPDSPIAGKSNIFIFPDLNSGNICYKMTERFAGFKAIGPVIQGVAKPFSDLSRGCSPEDIYYVAAITLLQRRD